MTSEPVVLAAHSGRRITWAGELCLTGDGESFVAVPFGGERLQGSAALVDDRARQVLSDLRAGVPQQHANARLVLPVIAERLGVDTDRLGVTACKIPVLLRLGMAAAYPDPAGPSLGALLADPAVVDTFVRPDRLGQRLVDLWGTQAAPRPWWLQKASRVETLALRAASAGEGWVWRSDVGGKGPLASARKQVFDGRADGQWENVPHGLRLLPCPWCGSLARLRSRMSEPSGYVCAGCRLDVAGVRWPRDPYDAFVAFPDLWAEAGVALEKVSLEPAATRRPSSGCAGSASSAPRSARPWSTSTRGVT